MECDSPNNKRPPLFRVSDHRGNHDYLTRKDKNETDHEIRQHFSKRYELDDEHRYHLPEAVFTGTSWQTESLMKLKHDLNTVKSKLNNFDLERWHAHTTYTNFAGFVIPTVRKLKPELLTQAWCKFYDISKSFSLIPLEAVESGVLNTIHLCEAPGAFIASLNHNLSLNFPQLKWEWRANTLNPYYEGNPLQRMINDDRFLMKTSKNWIFGEDFTGNICQRANLEHLKKTCEDMGPIHLVTADGSFDCTDDPAEQEGKVSPLLYCETTAALSILATGGSFVLKIFTIFECRTVCLLYLLRCTFKKVTIYKPVVSKEGNSELYVVCLGFKGKNSCENVVNELANRMEAAVEGPAMFRKEDINPFFLTEIERCSSFFTETQILVIERNIQLFQDGFSNKDKKILYRIKSAISELFVENFNLRPLPDNGYLLGKQAFYKRGLHFSPRDESGTFADRQYLKDTGASSLIEYYKDKLESMPYEWPFEDVHWLESSQIQTEGYTSEMCVRKGKPFRTIQSSRFCTGDLLTIFNDVLKNTKPVDTYDFWAQTPTSFLSSESMNCSAFTEFKMVNVRDKPWISDYHAAQSASVRELRTVLAELELGSHFVLVGFPLLTQFNVGLVFLLARNFKQIGFLSPSEYSNCIVFQDLQSMKFNELMQMFNANETERDSAHISLIDITALGESFLTLVTLFNQVLLRKSALLMASNSSLLEGSGDDCMHPI